ncbi:hypothetical protein Taro_051461 [Colocasia esculenta]|uniref:Uncharacterized protein n=1 Tax=Colocasia esculenta TaxID=4460 RepID=A0A843XG53_COLES|nr:hypothetical protein [Colocasia esculenta]
MSIAQIAQGYNQLIDHVGIHGQRRLTEALNKDSLVRQKEYPTESSSKVQPARRPYENPWTEETYGGIEQGFTSLA